jgi:hypothetical protein
MIRLKIEIQNDSDIWERARFFESEMKDKALIQQETHSNSISHSFKRGLVFMEYYHRIAKLIVKRELVLNGEQDFLFTNIGHFKVSVKNPEFEMCLEKPTPEIRLPWLNSTVFGCGYDFDYTFHYTFLFNENLHQKEEIKTIRAEFEQALKEIVREELNKDN